MAFWVPRGHHGHADEAEWNFHSAFFCMGSGDCVCHVCVTIVRYLSDIWLCKIWKQKTSVCFF